MVRAHLFKKFDAASGGIVTKVNTDEIEDVLSFWFVEHGTDDWFEKNDDFDAAIRSRFGALHERLNGDRDLALAWGETSRGALAALVVLDQFSRNLFRNDGRAFASDELAREVARLAIGRGFHRASDIPELGWLPMFLPFEHSENLADQDWSCAICGSFNDEDYLDYAHRHREIIQRFGRFPHRNAALGRESTAEELAFLEQPGSSF